MCHHYYACPSLALPVRTNTQSWIVGTMLPISTLKDLAYQGCGVNDKLMPENRLILSHISSICLSSRVGDGRDGPEQQQVCPSSPRLAVGEAGVTQAAEFHDPRECISDLMRGGEGVWGCGWGADQDPSLLCCESFHHCLYQGHTSHDYCQPMMDCKTYTKGGLFLGDVGPLTSSFGSTLKRCIAG